MLQQWICENTYSQKVLEEVSCSEGAVDLETPDKSLKF